MIPLSVYGKPVWSFGQDVIGRVTFEPVTDSLAPDHILVVSHEESAEALAGYAGVLSSSTWQRRGDGVVVPPLIHSVSTDHLKTGDVVALDNRGHVRTLFRRGSNHNAIFATDRCNSLCLMCSQPPRNVDDQWRVREHLRLIKLIDPETNELGITGGEPTLLRHGLVEIVRACKDYLPRTAVHILSNGRLFRYPALCREFASIEHPDLMVGIPLYSDIDGEHDFVVQAKGAFEETIQGLHTLARYGIAVEIRVVVHKLTVPRLPQLAEFIYRNLTFASHIALMGLEPTGFAVSNLDGLWIDPWDYRDQLEGATLFLASRGMPVSIYNHQLCVVPTSVWPYCRQSISDWKNEYLAQCAECSARTECGGLFASNLRRRYSPHIAPI